MLIRQAHATAQRLVARDGAMLAHQRAPEKRHQLLAAANRIVGPQLLVEGGVLDALLLVERRAKHVDIQAAEDLLTRAPSSVMRIT
jgi:hypothetical protein